jgi:hypothetical protein
MCEVIMTRYFTAEEATALLPLLEPHVRTIVRGWERLVAAHGEILAVLDRAPHNDLGGPLLADAAGDIIRAQNALLSIQAYGVELKDPATGLLNFPALREGVAVALSWRYGEPKIVYWPPETGAGRRPLIEE